MPEYDYVYTAASWCVVLGAGALLYMKVQNKNRLSAPQAKGQKAAQPVARKENRAKKQRAQAFNSDIAQTREKAAATSSEPTAVNDVAASRDSTRAAKDEDNNYDFAKQLAQVQEGTKFASRSTSEVKKHKSVKQSRAAEVTDFADDGKVSAASSTAGNDADDDQSPIESPQVTPADVSGVQDMLEPSAKGPSVLRLVDSGVPKKQPAPKQKDPAPPPLTKKQRQNQKKREAEKEARQEFEEERKIKMEAQRKTARIAEGRAAKDGSQFMAAVNGGASAWKAGAPNGTAPKAPAEAQFLDTFRPTPSAAEKETPRAQKADEGWKEPVLSEEEQLEILKSETEEWSTVPAKAKKSKKEGKAPAENGAVAAAPAQTAAGIPSKTAPVVPAAKTKPASSFGAFSALSTDELEDEQEQEWDV